MRKNKTVSLVLDTIRQVLNLAARKWRVEGNGRLTWLGQAPLITMLDLKDARLPKPITWAQQRVLLSQLSDHAAQMPLFVLNTGARDARPFAAAVGMGSTFGGLALVDLCCPEGHGDRCQRHERGRGCA